MKMQAPWIKWNFYIHILQASSIQHPESSMQLLCPESSVQLLCPESQNSDMWCYYNVIGVCGICLGCVGFDVDSCFEFSCGNSCSVFGRGLWSIFKCCLSFVFFFFWLLCYYLFVVVFLNYVVFRIYTGCLLCLFFCWWFFFLLFDFTPPVAFVLFLFLGVFS